MQNSNDPYSKGVNKALQESGYAHTNEALQQGVPPHHILNQLLSMVQGGVRGFGEGFQEGATGATSTSRKIREASLVPPTQAERLQSSMTQRGQNVQAAQAGLEVDPNNPNNFRFMPGVIPLKQAEALKAHYGALKEASSLASAMLGPLDPNQAMRTQALAQMGYPTSSWTMKDLLKSLLMISPIGFGGGLSTLDSNRQIQMSQLPSWHPPSFQSSQSQPSSDQGGQFQVLGKI